MTGKAIRDWILKMTVLAWGFTGVGCGTATLQPEKAVPESTRLAKVAMVSSDGLVVVLGDRSTWVVDPEQKERTLSWKKGDLIEAKEGSTGGFGSKLINQEEGTSVGARRSSDFDG